MPGSIAAELYFIGGMMILILILSFSAVYFFVRTYKREQKRKETAERKQVETAKIGSESTDL